MYNVKTAKSAAVNAELLLNMSIHMSSFFAVYLFFSLLEFFRSFVKVRWFEF